MNAETKLQIAELDDLKVGQLVTKYEPLFGEQCRTRNRRYPHRRIAWNLQSMAEGGLSEQAILCAEVLADESLVRVTPPSQRRTEDVAKPLLDNWDARLPPTGNLIERRYKGRTHRVLVLTEGLEFEGERFESLTAVARAITGSHCNGFFFFKLGQAT